MALWSLSRVFSVPFPKSRALALSRIGTQARKSNLDSSLNYITLHSRGFAVKSDKEVDDVLGAQDFAFDASESDGNTTDAGAGLGATDSDVPGTISDADRRIEEKKKMGGGARRQRRDDRSKDDDKKASKFRRDQEAKQDLLKKPSYRDARATDQRFSKNYADRYYVKDDKRTPARKDRVNSPEFNVRDKSIQWEKFSRASMYDLLSHYEISKRMGHEDFQKFYDQVIEGDVNEALSQARNGGDGFRQHDGDIRQQGRKQASQPKSIQEKNKLYSDMNDLQTRLLREQAEPGSEPSVSMYSAEQREKLLTNIAQTKVDEAANMPANLDVKEGEVYGEDKREAMRLAKQSEYFEEMEGYEGGMTDQEDEEVVKHVMWTRGSRPSGRILNDSEDEAGARIGINFDARANSKESRGIGSIVDWADMVTPSYKEKFGDVIEKMVEESKADKKTAVDFHNKFPKKLKIDDYYDKPNEFKRSMRADDPKTAKLFPTAHVDTSFEEWTRLIERNAFLRQLQLPELPREAEEALQKQWQILDKDKYTVEPLIIDSPIDSNDPLTVMEYQQRMIDVYGESFEPRERHAFDNPLPREMNATLSGLVESAPIYRETDPRTVKKELTETERLAERSKGKLDFDEMAANLVGLREVYFHDGTDVYGYMKPRMRDQAKLDDYEAELKEKALQDSDDEMRNLEDSGLATKPDRDNYDFTDWNETYNDLEYVNENYKHKDKDENKLMKILDPEGETFKAPRFVEHPEVYAIHQDVKKAIFKLNQVDPVKYHSRKLSAMFRLQLNRVKAILMLEYMEAQVAMKMTGEAGPNWAEAYFEMEVTDSDEDFEIIEEAEKADVVDVEAGEAGAAGEAKEASMDVNISEGAEGYVGTQQPLESGQYKKLISISGQEIEDTLTAFVKPGKAQWDPEFAPVVRKHADDRFVDEEDLALIKVIEKQKRARFWNKQEEEMRIEQERARTGEGKTKPFGAPHKPNTRTELYSTQVQEKNRYSYVLTDISDIKKSTFGIAVRDTNGTLREPTDTEFRWVRKREKHPKAFFRYKAYKPVHAEASN